MWSHMIALFIAISSNWYSTNGAGNITEISPKRNSNERAHCFKLGLLRTLDTIVWRKLCVLWHRLHITWTFRVTFGSGHLCHSRCASSRIILHAIVTNIIKFNFINKIRIIWHFVLHMPRLCNHIHGHVRSSRLNKTASYCCWTHCAE